MKTRPARATNQLRMAAGLALLAVLGGFAFVGDRRVPLLGWIDLAIHEFGHVATMWLPEVGSAIMGNGTQTLIPLALAGVFILRERDVLGGVVCLGWAATTLQDASVYIADAPYQRLQLIGGYHDWAFVLGEFGLVGSAAVIARVVWTVGLCLWIVAVAGAMALPALQPHLEAARIPLVPPSQRHRDRLARLGAGPRDIQRPEPPWV